MVVQLKGSLEVPELGWVSLVYRLRKETLAIWEGNPHRWETLDSVFLGYLYRKHCQRSGVRPSSCCGFLLLCVYLCVQNFSTPKGQFHSIASLEEVGF